MTAILLNCIDLESEGALFRITILIIILIGLLTQPASVFQGCESSPTWEDAPVPFFLQARIALRMAPTAVCSNGCGRVPGPAGPCVVW